jgi:hypothetical protein
MRAETLSLPHEAEPHDAAHDAAAGFSVPDLCRRWKVGADKIHGFIHRGELVAVNLATDQAGRPQWRITRESVEAFERRRSSQPPPKAPRTRRRAPASVDFTANW